MEVIIKNDPKELGRAAGIKTAQLINEVVRKKGEANVILATGASQFETLNQLIIEDIDWSKVTMFHLDEYIDLPESHPASFRKYLKERFLDKVSPLKAFHLINGETDPDEERQRLGMLIEKHPIDVALVGIGENAHLAFNDPPADFETLAPYLIVNLDADCRGQQLKEGWFESIDEVPKRAVSMSVNQIMKSEVILCSAPDARKAVAVQKAIEGEVSNLVPASILQTHPNCMYYLDKNSAKLLS